MSLPVIFLHILAARAVEDGGSSLITVFKPTNTNIIILHELSFNRNFYDFMLQEGNADPALKLDFDIFLLFFQTPFGPAELLLLNMYMSGQKKEFLFLKNSVCWMFGLPSLHHIN